MISRTLGEIARLALTAVSAEGALQALRALAQDGDLQVVAELAAALDASLGYGTPPPAYQAAATIEDLVAAETLPPLARLYASGFFSRYAALNPQAARQLARDAMDHRAYARFACLLQLHSSFENEILRAFLLTVAGFAFDAARLGPGRGTPIIDKIMRQAEVVEGHNAGASFQFGRDLLASNGLGVFVMVAAHEMQHNVDALTGVPGPGTLRRRAGIPTSWRRLRIRHIADQPVGTATGSVGDLSLTVPQLGSLVAELKTAALATLSGPAPRQEAAPKTTASGLRVLLTIQELPEGFLQHISLSDRGGSLPLDTGAAYLYAILHMLDVSPTRAGLAYSPSGRPHLMFLLSPAEFRSFSQVPLCPLEGQALAGIEHDAGSWLDQMRAKDLVAGSEYDLLRLLGLARQATRAYGSLDEIAAQDINLCENLRALPDLAALAGPGADLDALLSAAIRRADPVLVERLVRAGASAAGRSPDGYPWAAYAGYSLAVVEREGVKTYYGPTAEDLLQTLEILFASGLPVDATVNEDGDSFLIDAARRSARAVSFLLARGADVRRRNHRGEGAVYAAASAGNVEALAMLLGSAKAEVDALTLSGMTPLMRAAESGLPEVIRLLLDHGADAGAATGLGYTALHFALLTPHYAGQAEMVQALLSAGAGADEETNDGLTPLLQVLKGYLDVAFERELLESLKDTPMEPDPHWETLARLLLEAGADPAHEDLEGRSPLSLAAKLGTDDAVRRLLEQAASR